MTSVARGAAARSSRTLLHRRFGRDTVALPMSTVSKKPPANSKLHARILALGDKCSDLLKRDLRNARSRCHRQHCERIWEGLGQKEREMIRRKLVDEDPHLAAGTTGYLLESECVTMIEEELKEAGKVSRRRRHPARAKRTTGK